MLRLGYCLPFLGTPHVPLFPSQCLFPAPSPFQGLFWRISPWSWFPRLLWSLLHSLLQASTAFCSWCCRPRGHGVRSSPSPISFSLWTCHTFSWGPFRLYAPVGESGRLLASFDLREAYIPVPVHPASRPFLRFLFRDTVYQFQALYFGLSTAPQVFPWVMAPVSAILHSLGIRMRRSLDTWLVQSSSQESLFEVLLPVLRLCPVFWDCHPSQVFQPHTFPGSAVSVGRLRFHLFQGFSVGGMHLLAAICNRRIYVMRLAYREPVAVASRRSFFASSPSSGRLAFFLRWLASFLAATWDCSPSSSASIVPGTVRIWGLQS